MLLRHARKALEVELTEIALSRLENSLSRVVDLIQTFRSENERLNQKVQQLKKDVEELREENQAKNSLIKRFENDRLKIRSRVGKVVHHVSTLGKP